MKSSLNNIDNNVVFDNLILNLQKSEDYKLECYLERQVPFIMTRFTVLFIAIDGPVSFKKFPSICYTCQIFWNALSQLTKGYRVQCKRFKKEVANSFDNLAAVQI